MKTLHKTRQYQRGYATPRPEEEWPQQIKAKGYIMRRQKDGLYRCLMCSLRDFHAVTIWEPRDHERDHIKLEEWRLIRRGRGENNWQKKNRSKRK